jgi:Bacterial antitoxin of type II TA system, VapB
MRTTVDIDDLLLERAKRLALKEKQTLGAVVGEALAAYLASRRLTGKAPPFELLVRGSARGKFPAAADMLEIEEEEDVRALGIPEAKRRATP